MNQVASNLAGEKELRGAVQNKTFTSKKEREQGSYTRQNPVWLLLGYFPLDNDRVLRHYLISGN